MEMTQPLCPECGAQLASSAGDALCLSCLLRLAVVADASDDSQDGDDYPVQSSTAERPGSRIGHYKLLEPIGEGGFGTVWMAEQIEPLRRCVALKIIKLGMDTREVVARFEAERQALALMDHPNIARVFDGGATTNGRPYFVMELVKGVRITDYCDMRRFGTRERLRLFIEVCQAVQHAHQKGVIHRDLKPSNVLVTEVDGRAVPKVIDFGIAKATEQSLTTQTLYTRFNQVIGTPAYMSPEQACLGSLDVDTRSDIYALGVLLYELLTGRAPFSNEELLKAGLDEILRTIREKEPPKPSTKLTSLTPSDLSATARCRAIEPGGLPRLVRGELDWIVMKCLEKDRVRRYQTANGLAGDIDRHLNQEPVLAAPPSVGYRVGKFARRYRTALTAVGAVVLVALVGAAASLVQAVRASRHAAAEMHLRRVAETNEAILRQTIYASDMSLAAQALERGDGTTARQMLRTYLPDGSKLDVRGWDWRHLWHRAQGDPARGILGHTSTVTAIAFLADGERLLSASYDGTIREWDFASGRQLRRWDLPGHRWRGLALHPSGTNVVSYAVDEDAMASVDLVSGRTRIESIAVNRTSYSLVASPDGQAYLHGAGGWGFTSTNSTIVVRDATLANPRRLPESGSRVVFSPDGRSLATGTWLDRIKLWSWPALEPLGELGPVCAAASLEFSPDGRRLLVGGQGGEITLWDMSTKSLLFRRTAHGGTTVGAVRFSPDGRRIASAGGDQSLVIWDAETLGLVRLLRGYLDQVWQVRWTPDGQSLVSTTLGAGIRVWPANETRALTPAGVNRARPVHFSPDSRLLALELAVPPAVAVWSTAEWREIARLEGKREAHGFLSGGAVLVLEERDANRVEFRRFPSFEIERTVALESPPTNSIGGMCRVMSRDGRLLAQCRESGWITVWDLATGRLRRHFEAHRGGVRKAVFSPDGRWLLSCGMDHVARLWKADSFDSAATYTGEANASWDVAFSADGSKVVVGWMNATYRVFERASGRMLASFQAGEAALAALPGDSQTLVTIDDNRRQLRFWNLASHREAGTLSMKVGVGQFLTMSPDETLLVSDCPDRTLCFWHAPTLGALDAHLE